MPRPGFHGKGEAGGRNCELIVRGGEKTIQQNVTKKERKRSWDASRLAREKLGARWQGLESGGDIALTNNRKREEIKSKTTRALCYY